MTSSRIIIADDHPLFRDALTHSIRSAVPEAEVVEAGSLDELTKKLEQSEPVDLILLDLTMPGVHGLSGLMFLRADHPEIPVVVVSASEDPVTIRRCLECGALGFVPKSAPEKQIREAVQAVMAGQVWTPPGLELPQDKDRETRDMIARIATLTPQQIRVLMMLEDEGISNKLIAYRFGVKEATIKAHVSEILRKLNVDNRTQASNAFKRISNLDWQKPKA
jgi:DNA-binding NarL/FixJ family response regulator